MIVVDCSALVFFLSDEGPTGHRVRERVAKEDRLAAPHLIDYEIMSALLGLARGRRGGEPKLSEKQLRKAVATYRDLALDRHETLILWERVKGLSSNLSAYDAQYVALAESLGLPLITSDARIDKSGVARCEIETFETSG
ncbi:MULTISPECIES: type II toxin-antitoxin system VapC family toxin [Streptomyces]|uniref:Ribonuclease VapC n=1 Tax=Streptomyces milbemycinicus TaxID=476552 RepID=A0ABW8LRW2_9ACTN|nr:type II toxin-antitoxin system VapC family toxin [Streptomyces sp. ME19-01-6]MDW6063896.1 type II toxin-antitoxin system VapC family toxin [Streptomyces sp. FXJ1.4098]MDX3228714.1 type II toxin-antitoxin system VapC family toxin [Streptomyces sp. ME19-01-6]